MSARGGRNVCQRRIARAPRSMIGTLLIVAVILAAPGGWVSAELAFPRDHGPHPDHSVESWYFSGRLAGETGQAFAFHLGFFRLGLESGSPGQRGGKRSAWAFEEAYRAELGITDLESGEFQSFEHLSRGALGLAGARSVPAKVWVYDWFMEVSSDAPSGPIYRLSAGWGEGVRLDLEAKAKKPALAPGAQPVLPGGPSRGAGQWYAFTRMTATGRLAFAGQSVDVNGEVWLDRLWREAAFDLIETSFARGDRGAFLSSGQIAVNRFALQLENGWELLIFQLHRRDGTGTPVPGGTLVYADGASRRLSRDELELTESGQWTSPAGARYPAAWRIAVPGERLDLDVRASVPDQEVRESVRYWSGAVDIRGTIADQAAAGQGHAALVGYAAQAED